MILSRGDFSSRPADLQEADLVLTALLRKRAWPVEEPKPLKLDQHVLDLDSHINQPLSVTLLKYRDLR